jgi:hypothetical protein
MKCIIKQPCGLGDILFTSKIRHLLAQKGYEVIHPVIKEFKWVGNYIDGNWASFPILDETFPYYDLYNNFRGLYPAEVSVNNEQLVIVPLQTADQLYSGSVMDAKYKLVELPLNDWHQYLSINRNKEKEDNLFYNILNLKDNEKYIVTNPHYGSPPNFNTRTLPINTTFKCINITFLDNVSFFDWIKVLEKAEEIHVVESSINYILQAIDIDPNKVFIYSKHTPSNFDAVKHLFTKNWNYVY